MKLLFLCRGSAHDGIGHVIRSRSVALHAAEQAGVTVRLVAVGAGYVGNLLQGRGLDYEVVADDDGAMVLLRKLCPDVVVFDLMSFDRGRVKQIAAQAMTVSLSPIFNALQDVDLVFHRTTLTGPGWPTARDRLRVRSGLRYAVVRENCHRIPEEVFRQSLAADELAVAISMGGTDAANKTLEVLEALKRVRQTLLLWVMLGEGYAHSYENLVRCMQGSCHEVILAKTSQSMWRVLGTCSLVVLAGGTTTYEAAYAGLPSINTLETPDHLYLVRELMDRGVCLCAGDTFPESLAKLEPLVSGLVADRDRLLDMHRRSRGLIDGGAVERIVRDIRAFCRQHRPAEVA